MNETLETSLRAGFSDEETEEVGMQENGSASPGRFGQGLSDGSGGAASGWGMNGPGSNGWFRSLEMEYVQIVVHESAVRPCLSNLGDLGAVQFEDQNKGKTALQRCDIHRSFAHSVKELRKCDELDRSIRYIESQLMKFDIPISQLDLDDFLHESAVSERSTNASDKLDAMKSVIAGHEAQLLNSNSLIKSMVLELDSLDDKQDVLKYMLRFGGRDGDRQNVGPELRRAAAASPFDRIVGGGAPVTNGREARDPCAIQLMENGYGEA